MPDPVAKISWDNFAAIPVAYAEENGLKNEDVIRINGIHLPVFVQPGQAKDTISVALGYGREIAGKVGNKVGTNLYPLVENVNGARQYYIAAAKVEKVPGKTFELAISQTHYLMEGRPIVRERPYRITLKIHLQEMNFMPSTNQSLSPFTRNPASMVIIGEWPLT